MSLENSFYLPEECWELIIGVLQNHHHHLESVSLVSKQFLSITNNLRVSLRVSGLTVPLLPKIFQRFKKLKHIDLQDFHGDLDGLLLQIAASELDLDSLNLSNQRSVPLMGLRVLGSRMQNLRALNCSRIGSLENIDLTVISGSFPYLEELDISYPLNGYSGYSSSSHTFSGAVTDSGVLAFSSRLKRLRKVNISGNPFISDKSLLALSTNCVLLRDIVICDCDFITQSGISLALRHIPNLNSISANGIGIPSPSSVFSESVVNLKALCSLCLSNSFISDDFLFSLAEASSPLRKLLLSRCQNFTFEGISFLLYKKKSIECLDLEAANFLTDQSMSKLSKFLPSVTSINLSFCSKLTGSTIFTLARNCPVLNEIKMEKTNLGQEEEENFIADLVVNPRIKSLSLCQNNNLSNDSVKKIASICSNLEQLKLNYCAGITEEGVLKVLRSCTKIRHLELNHCMGMNNFVIDFELPSLEVLELQGSRMNDEALAIVGKRCSMLHHLDLLSCLNVTAKGVKEVVKNCRRLRMINLRYCDNIDYSVVSQMVFSIPSLRKIISPCALFPSDNQKSFFLRHGCLVLTDGFQGGKKGFS